MSTHPLTLDDAMALLATLNAYRALTTEQKAFLRSKQIENTLPLDHWYAFFAPLETYDRHGDNARKIAGVIAIAAPIGAFVFTLLGLFLPVGILLLLIFAMALPTYLILRKNNVPNLLRDFLVPMLAVLQQDVPSAEPLHLGLDLTGLNESKQTEPPPNTPDPSAPSGYPKIRETYYADPWLTGATQFVDGARVKWEITDRVRERHITKRSASGKIKTKYKHKIKRRIDVRLEAPTAHYALDTNEAAGADVAVRVKPGTKRHAVSARRTLITKVDGSYGHARLAMQPFLDTIAHAYRNVKHTVNLS